MSEILFQYHPVNPTTWVYLSSLLIIGLFFKFNRFWSVRNLDLILLICLSPGLLLVLKGISLQRSAAYDKVANSAAVDAANSAEPSSPVSDALEQKQAKPTESNLPTDPNDGVGEKSASESAPPAASGAARPLQSNADAQTESAAENSPNHVAASLSSDNIAISGSGVVVAEPEANAAVPGVAIARVGFIWLFAVGGCLLLRLLLDPAMVRRPLLEPNLNAGGMTFVGICLFVFLMANVLTGEPTISGLSGARQSASPGGRTDGLPAPDGNSPSTAAGNAPTSPTGNPQENGNMARVGPGYPLLFLLPRISTSSVLRQVEPNDQERTERVYALTARLMAILAHLAIVLGMVFIGYMHFDNIRTGVSTATLYLMLPYTSQMTGFADHCVPAALLVWLVASYRRPLVAGLLLGMAAGTIYYPAFLIPLWLSFYWQKGLPRFLLGLGVSLLIMSIGLRLSSNDWWHYWLQLMQMFGIRSPLSAASSGFWDPAILHNTYRLPVLAAFLALSFGMLLWPAHKNLGTLLNCSAAVMLGTQFWHAHNGGIFMAWYLPLLLLTIFRPNLEDRIAIAVLAQGWLEKGGIMLQRANSSSSRGDMRVASTINRPNWLAMPLTDRGPDIDSPQPLRS